MKRPKSQNYIYSIFFILLILPMNAAYSQDKFWENTPKIVLHPQFETLEFEPALYKLSEGVSFVFDDIIKDVSSKTPSKKMDVFPMTPWVMAFRLDSGPESLLARAYSDLFRSENRDSIVLRTPFQFIETGHLICQNPTTHQVESIEVSRNVSISRHPYFMLGVNVPINTYSFSNINCFFYMKKNTPISTSLILQNEYDFIKSKIIESGILFTYFGIVGGLLIYNILIYFFLKDSVYIWYSLTTLFIHLLFQSWFSTVDMFFLHLESVWWNGALGYFYLHAAIFTLLKFSETFFNLKSGFLYKTIKLLIYINVFTFSLIVILPLPISTKISGLTGCLTIAFPFLYSFIRFFKEKDKLSLIYGLAWTFPSIGGILLFLRIIRMIPSSIFTEYFLVFGGCMESLILALGLGYRYRYYREEAKRHESRHRETLKLRETEKWDALKQRIRLGAQLSDAMNSPIMGLSNGLEQLQKRIRALKNPSDPSTQNLIRFWDLCGEGLLQSLRSLNQVSQRLSQLRESDDKGLETTALLREAPKSTSPSAPLEAAPPQPPPHAQPPKMNA